MASLFCRYGLGAACIGFGQCSVCGLTAVPPKPSVRSSGRNRFARSRAPRPSPPCPSFLPRFPFLLLPPARYVDEPPASSLPPCSFFPLLLQGLSSSPSPLLFTPLGPVLLLPPEPVAPLLLFPGSVASPPPPRSSPPPVAVASSSSSGDGLGSLVCVAGRGLPLGFVREDQWQSSCSPEKALSFGSAGAGGSGSGWLVHRRPNLILGMFLLQSASITRSPVPSCLMTWFLGCLGRPSTKG